VGNDLTSYFRHELGHDLYNVGFPRSRQMDWNKRFEKYVGTATVSRYGGTNTSELFSESFSAYSNRNYVRGSLPADVEACGAWQPRHLAAVRSPPPVSPVLAVIVLLVGTPPMLVNAVAGLETSDKLLTSSNAPCADRSPPTLIVQAVNGPPEPSTVSTLTTNDVPE
jgi:hypothetical protein